MNWAPVKSPFRLSLRKSHSLQACIPVGDLDRGYSLQHNFFEEGAFLLTHGSQDQATAQAPVANVYSAGVPADPQLLTC